MGTACLPMKRPSITSAALPPDTMAAASARQHPRSRCDADAAPAVNRLTVIPLTVHQACEIVLNGGARPSLLPLKVKVGADMLVARQRKRPILCVMVGVDDGEYGMV